MAELMKTSRTALDRLLDRNNTSGTRRTLDTVAKAIGKTQHVELVSLIAFKTLKEYRNENKARHRVARRQREAANDHQLSDRKVNSAFD